MELRSVILALTREGYARQVKPPPDNNPRLPAQLSMQCINPECSGRATINYSIATDTGRAGLYNCQQCGVTGDAISLIIWLAGEDLNPYDELEEREVVAQAHVWAEQFAGSKPESKDDASDSAYAPSWLQ